LKLIHNINLPPQASMSTQKNGSLSLSPNHPRSAPKVWKAHVLTLHVGDLHWIGENVAHDASDPVGVVLMGLDLLRQRPVVTPHCDMATVAEKIGPVMERAAEGAHLHGAGTGFDLTLCSPPASSEPNRSPWACTLPSLPLEEHGCPTKLAAITPYAEWCVDIGKLERGSASRRARYRTTTT
jgi:hypothetical protein